MNILRLSASYKLNLLCRSFWGCLGVVGLVCAGLAIMTDLFMIMLVSSTTTTFNDWGLVMATPPLLQLSTEADYRRHFDQKYCRGTIKTRDGVRVYFSRDKFKHAFFESTKRDGVKDSSLSLTRAERMDWIIVTLQNKNANWYQGWDKGTKQIDPTRSVCAAYEEFVVVLSFSLNKKGDLKANFITCYLANNSIEKIRTSPQWTETTCRNAF